jgi:hypothetical protein
MRALQMTVVTAVLLSACAGTPTVPAGRVESPAVSSPSSVAAALRAAGLTVEDAGIVEQPFFTGRAHVYVVEGDVQVYEFASADAAQQSAAQVSPTGGSIGTQQMSWMAPPHFFRKQQLVVIYLGSSPKVLAELQNLMGAQFAGGK